MYLYYAESHILIIRFQMIHYLIILINLNGFYLKYMYVLMQLPAADTYCSDEFFFVLGELSSSDRARRRAGAGIHMWHRDVVSRVVNYPYAAIHATGNAPSFPKLQSSDRVRHLCLSREKITRLLRLLRVSSALHIHTCVFVGDSDFHSVLALSSEEGRFIGDH